MHGLRQARQQNWEDSRPLPANTSSAVMNQIDGSHTCTSPEVQNKAHLADLPSVCIIIPTTCEERRYPTLCRAIESILQQKNVSPRVLVVANGVKFSPERLRTLQARADIDVVYEAEGSSVKAINIGRTMVNEDFFGFLDDDDEYLPSALSLRLAPMLADAQIDYVASNGLRRTPDGCDEPFLTATKHIEAQPLEQLLQSNWLASCGGLFRSRSVLAKDFDPSIKYFEWTYLAFMLAGSRRMAFVDAPTFRIYSTPGSLSKSIEYQTAETDVLQRILKLPLPKNIAKALKVKLSDAHHDAADCARAKGQWRLAWKHHVRSLRMSGGLRYLAFTRHLLLRH